jgi:hypothetical protein
MTISGWFFLILHDGQGESRGMATFSFISYDLEFFTDYFLSLFIFFFWNLVKDMQLRHITQNTVI